MIKKIALITLFVLFAGVLVAGGVYRTSAKSGYDISLGGENIVEISQSPDNAAPRSGQAAGAEEHQQDGERAGQGLGNGGTAQGRNQKTESAKGEESAIGQVQGQQGQGQGQRGQGQGQQGQGQGQNQQAERTTENGQLHEQVIIEGTISQAPAAGVDMIIETADGQVLVGTGPGYLQEQGFDLDNGDAVQVSGFFEIDEFKATTITRLSEGAAIALRDEAGRPMWSGAGRRAASGENQGNGQGKRDNGQADS